MSLQSPTGFDSFHTPHMHIVTRTKRKRGKKYLVHTTVLKFFYLTHFLDDLDAEVKSILHLNCAFADCVHLLC